MPPPQTRSIFMFASAADLSSQRYLSRVIREGKLSAGIQLAPFAKTGTPLTTNVKLLPHESLSCRTSSERSPTCTDFSSATRPSINRRARYLYSGWAPKPLGHHNDGFAT